MPPATPMLPILERRDEIAALIRDHQIVVLCGQTGSGKTTQLPQICLDLGLAERGRIAHTQPRRLAARAVAARIAEERGTPLGQLVGVKVRFHEQTSRATKIKVMTDGMLLAELAGDRDLPEYSVIIIDEAHERSLNIDFLLGYLRTLLARRRDLKLIVTSATIDPKRFSDYFGGPSVAPVIEVSGRMYPVEVRYAPPPGSDDEPDRVHVEAVADAVEDVTGGAGSGGGGDVLVFLPGEREIRQCAEAITRRRLSLEVLPLFSRLSNAEQDRIFHPAAGRQRVILGTNIAETSLTVPGIRYVVDTGLARQARYDPARKVQRLPIEPVSRASADQRAGRCGRVQSGVCVRLYSESSYRSRPAFTDPEIRRTSLASVILSMLTLELGPIAAFPFIEPPSAEAIDDGYHTLFEIGASDAPSAEGQLTDIGRAIARIPVEPRVARMLLAAQREGVVDDVITLAAALSIQDPRERPAARQEAADSAHRVFRDETSDFLTLLNIAEQYRHASDTMTSGALIGWCREHFLSAARMREWGEMIYQLREIARELDLPLAHAGQRTDPDRVHRALLTGLISNVACREAEQGSYDYRGVRGNVVQIFPGSALFKKSPKWIMAAEVVHTTRLYARTVAKIEPAWVEELAGHMFKRQLSDAHLDVDTGVPSAFERVSMSGIVVVPRRPTELAKADPAAARRLFVAEALAKAKWKTDLPLIAHTRAMLAKARQAEDRLRRRNLARSDEELAAWFESRLPPSIHDPAGLAAWLAASPDHEPRLRLSPTDVLKPEASSAFDTARFPDTLTLAGEPVASCPLTYALAPGKDDDGLTADVPLLALDRLNPDRSAWLVPGMLGELVHVLLKQLPKERRAALEAKAALAETAASIADVLDFASAPLPAAISEAIEVLHGVRIDAAAIAAGLKGLPDFLKLRVRVLDEHGKPIAESRDTAVLLAKLQPRLAKAKAERAKDDFARTGLTAWTFGDLPESVESDGAQAFPALLDDRDSVSLTLAGTPEQAAALTHHGVRRLFALACMDELGYLIDALPNTADLARQYQAFGSAAELKADLACVIAERVFMSGQSAVRTRAAFEARLAEQRGRLVTATREVGELVGKILEPRAKVAHRLASGTPRLWATSIADIREHATYLLPRGFLLQAPEVRLRRYPIYVESMRERLFSLREEGSKVEQGALAAFSPHWKRYTGWVAHAMSRERETLEAAGQKQAARAPGKTKAPLPQTRRTGAVVNLDAGEWAMRGGINGVLPAPVETYRWALEELRVALFAPQLAGSKPAMTVAELERLWKLVPPAR